MSAFVLRIIACAAMLIDHIGYQYGIVFFRQLGRIAFPIFVFLICNGYRHTSSPLRYGLRLGIFALISQVPFSLFCYNLLWQDKGNVFMTLFLSLVCIWWADRFWKKKNLRYLAFLPALAICALYYFQVWDSDYGIRGILLALMFFFFAREKKKKPWILVAGMLIAIYYPVAIKCLQWFLGGAVPRVSSWEVTQIYSLFALPLILSYNGQKGGTPGKPLHVKLTQLGFYFFYPAHMLVLWFLQKI